MSQLLSLYNDFVEAAVRIGKIIVDELELPDKDKTIKPLDIGTLHYTTFKTS